MDNQSIGFLISLIMILVNIVALFWNMRKTSLQHQKTGELAKLTSNLQNDVNRLSVSLDQEITRLERMKDLTNGVYLSAARITAKFRWGFVDPEATAGKEEWRAHYLEELVSSRVTIDGSFVEMFAIAKVIGDAKLTFLVEKYKESVPRKENIGEAKWINRMRDFESEATALHEQIYKLLQDTTKRSMTLTEKQQ